MYPKVLVISNECFSNSTSNGRTLGNFFIGWPKECLAQFFLSGIPEFRFCENYFQISDSQALRSLLGKEVYSGKILEENVIRENLFVAYNECRKTARNACTMLARELVWSFVRWGKLGYWEWTAKVQPEIVLLQAGDCAFMFDLALRTAKKHNAKFVIYNTEGYYFKNYDYFKANGIAHFAYPLFRYVLRRSIKIAYRAADYAIFNCDALQEDFSKEFMLKSKVIYTATDSIGHLKEKEIGKGLVVSYAGNLGVGRSQSLVDIANTLHDISSDYYLDVYGTILDEDTKESFNSCKGIRFHGRISYDEVKQVIKNSDILVHAESFDSYYIEDLKYAFSTKIADCLASNRCFLMYAPISFAETRYLLDNQAAYVVTDKSELKETLVNLTENIALRNRYCNKAMEVAKKNHDCNTSIAMFQKILCELQQNEV
jgi:glycosyltransferase involved in cell wall biosynthesis